MTILDHYNKEKQRYLDNCTQCGWVYRRIAIWKRTNHWSVEDRLSKS